jgi:hypothetical protein
MATGDWRMVNAEWRVGNGFFLEDTVPAVPKKFGRAGTKLEGCSPEQPNSFKIFGRAGARLSRTN